MQVSVQCIRVLAGGSAENCIEALVADNFARRFQWPMAAVSTAEAAHG